MDSHPHQDSLQEEQRKMLLRRRWGRRGPYTLTRGLAVDHQDVGHLSKLTLEGFFLISFKNSPRTTSHLPMGKEKGNSTCQPGPDEPAQCHVCSGLATPRGTTR